MGNNILLKKSSVTGKIPLTTDLQYGEIAINYADGKLYYKSNAGSVGILNPTESDNFKTIAVSGQSNVVADNPTATLTLSPSVGIDITTNAATDTITFAHSDTSTVGNISSDNGAGTVLQDISLTFDTFGHVTAASVGTVNLDSRYLQAESDTLNTVTTRGATTSNAITVGGLTVNGNATITGDISGADSFTFDTTATEADGIAKVYWNNSLGVLRVGLNGGNVAVDVPKTQVAFVTNAEATTLAKGEVVYLFGAQGDRPTVKRAANDSDTTSSRTFGVVAEAITAGGQGYIITSGVCEGLSLGAYTPGDILWLGSSPGTFTTTKPVAPAHGVFVGIVQRANPGNGQLYVKIQNGYELGEIHDVYINGKATNDSLFYDGTLGVWKNTPPATARTNLGLGTISTQNANNVAITGGTINGTAIGGTSAAAANFTTVGTTGNVTIGGNLTVQGTTTTVSAQNLAIADNLFYLNDGSTNTNPDLGFAANYNDGSYRHTGFFRDATDGYWKVFKNYTPEPDASIYIDTSHASFALADIQAANFRGALVGNADTATVLQTARTINGVSFNGSANITISSNTTNALTLGDGLSGTSFNGSAAVTAAVDSSIARRADVTYIGTTSVALNRTSAALALTGITSVTAPTDLTLNTGLTVTSGGNVGIKTASPQSTLAVQFVDNSTVSIGLQHPNSAKLMQIGWNDTDYTYINTFNGSRALVLQNTGGNVGIGTTSPSYKLQVAGSADMAGLLINTSSGRARVTLDSATTAYSCYYEMSGGGSQIGFLDGNYSSGYIRLATSKSGAYLAFETGVQSEKMRIDSSGNVGISTTSPAYRLDISGVDNDAIRIRNSSGTQSNGIALGVGQNSPFLDLVNGVEFRIKGNTYANLGTWNSGSNTKFIIDASGNVGIGTASPNYKLDVQGGGARLLQSGGVALNFSNNSTRNWDIGLAASEAFYIKDVVANLTRVTIDTSGNVGIGITGPAFTHGSGLQVNAATTATIRVQYNSGYATELFADSTGTNLWQLSSAALTLGTDNTERIRIDSSGNVGIGTQSPNEKLSIAYADNSYARIEFRSASYARQAIIEGVDDNSGGNGHMAFYTRNSGSVYERLRIASGGNVGIATTAPEAPLHIVGGYDANNPNSLVISGRESAGNVYTGVQFERSGGGTFFGIGADARSDRDEIAIGGAFGGVINATAIRFFTGTRGGTIGTERLSIISSGNVGIGTASPSGTYGKLTVAGGIRTTDDTSSKLELGRYSSGAPNSYIKLGANSNALFITNAADSADIFTILNSGNVGIGITSPSQPLHVSGNARITGALYDSANSAGTSGQVLTSTGTGTAWSSSGAAITGTGTTNYVAKFTGTTVLANSSIFDDGTNVGIGTASPTVKLHVAGNAKIGANNQRISLYDDGNAHIHSTDSILWINSETNTDVRINNQYNGNVILTNGIGSVGIGTSSPSERLDVTGNIKASGTIEAGSNITYGTNQVFSSSTITTTATTANQVITAVSSTAYRTAKFIIQATDATGGKYQSQEILAVHNGSTVAHTEYTAINVGGAVATYDVDISGGTLRLLCTPLSSNSTVFKVQMTLIKS